MVPKIVRSACSQEIYTVTVELSTIYRLLNAIDLSTLITVVPMSFTSELSNENIMLGSSKVMNDGCETVTPSFVYVTSIDGGS